MASKKEVIFFEQGVKITKVILMHGSHVVDEAFTVSAPSYTPETWAFGGEDAARAKVQELFKEIG